MKRFKHSLSFQKLTSFDMGQLVPVGITEVLPGDTIQQSSNALVRILPLLAPMYTRADVHIHHWFVPHRLVWTDWEDFITGGDYGSTAPVFPTVTGYTNTVAVPVGGLLDHYGWPSGFTARATHRISALPFRGYATIFNEWYRDQDLTTELTVSKASGNDATTYSIQRVNWEKDYLTTARPWAQKGNAPTVPVERVSAAGNAWKAYQLGGNTPTADSDMVFDQGEVANATGVGQTLDPNGTLVTSIDDIRLAGALQRYMEARARYGSRYTEYLRYLGVRSSDARLQRPEYLGGGRVPLQISEVLQTSVTTSGDANNGPGELFGHGITSLRSNRFRKFFEEHGYIHSLMFVRPKNIWMNGAPRTFLKRTKEDFFQKELQFIGQQAIANEEVQMDQTSEANQLATFGYQDRYDEYRRGKSSISGEFRTTLNFWHQAVDFGTSIPALNDTFIRAVPPDRVYQVTTANELQVMVNHSIQARRMVAPSGGESFIR